MHIRPICCYKKSKTKHFALTLPCRCHCRGDDVKDSSLLTGSEEESTLESFIPPEESSLLMPVSYLALLFPPSGLRCSLQEYWTPFCPRITFATHSPTHSLTYSLMLDRFRNLVTKIYCAQAEKSYSLFLVILEHFCWLIFILNTSPISNTLSAC